MKYYREHFWSKFNQKNNQNVWLSELLYIPKWPRDRAVADFRIATDHTTACLSKHLNMIGIAQSLCKLCDSNGETGRPSFGTLPFIQLWIHVDQILGG
ncbi:hypothetical protein TNIN_121871 [Trichonephila inaurata madagascariensis]|uniref:Uncharacterized protein n=1 Tax=Trichonephila inaurata madagascariensis TaxID=2747483 RepID=A0A8X6WRC2_9ARAC|nr:hypothetical protein TNIN_121871 [Trichonephila inaurata madagascariensis]